MQHPDEGTIHAWLDGALSTEEGTAVGAHVGACAECAAAVAEARGLIAASSRIVSSLDTVPGGVLPGHAAPVRRPAWYSTKQFRAAAAVLLVAGASMLLLQDREGESAEDLSQQVMSTASAETSQSLPARENLAVAGSVTESDMVGLTVISRDSTAVARTTIFMAEPGGTVTLTETSALLPVRAMARERQLSARAADASVAAPPPPPVNQRMTVLSISWTDSVTKRNVTLSGPFPKEKLEELRKQIEAKEQKD